MNAPSRPDDLLTALAAARPAPDHQPSAASPEAAAMLARILAGGPCPGRARVPRAIPRRLVLAGIPVAAAAAAAGAVVASSAGPPGPGPATLTASRVRAAILDALRRSDGDVFGVVATRHAPGQPPVETREWYYPLLDQPARVEKYRSTRFRDGAKALDAQVHYTRQPKPGEPLDTEVLVVDYGNRTWFRGQQLSPAQVFSLFGIRAPGNLRKAVDQGVFKVAGRERIHGVDAIKITFTAALMTIAFWVDARTYIPLQAVTADTGQHPFTETARYRVLPATSANLGLLTVPVPAGFTRTTSPPDFSVP
jgi:hypothetical protein